MNNKDIDAMSGKTDERKQGEWKTRYTDNRAIWRQRIEAIYIMMVIIASFVILLLNYNGVLQSWFCIPNEKQVGFSRLIICSICGLLGGAIFDLKWFYKSIAHGFWNQDRTYWRLFTPVISLGLAFCLACVFSDSVINNGSGNTAATLGFLSGYFSDEAVGKMAEVAKVLFNTKSSDNKDSSKSKNSADK